MLTVPRPAYRRDDCLFVILSTEYGIFAGGKAPVSDIDGEVHVGIAGSNLRGNGSYGIGGEGSPGCGGADVGVDAKCPGE